VRVRAYAWQRPYGRAQARAGQGRRPKGKLLWPKRWAILRPWRHRVKGSIGGRVSNRGSGCCRNQGAGNRGVGGCRTSIGRGLSTISLRASRDLIRNTGNTARSWLLNSSSGWHGHGCLRGQGFRICLFHDGHISAEVRFMKYRKFGRASARGRSKTFWRLPA